MDLQTIANIVRILPFARMAHSDRQRIYNLLEQSLADTTNKEPIEHLMHMLKEFDSDIVLNGPSTQWSKRFQRAAARAARREAELSVVKAFGEPPALGSDPPAPSARGPLPKPKPKKRHLRL